MQDCKSFLKENCICYKCCSSSSHLAKDCNVSVKCSECGTADHNPALHPGSAPWSAKNTLTDSEHGGEERNTTTTTPEITSQCTEICKGSIDSRSGSKICLVRVYPKGHRDKAVKLYAILDDQSNRSLARSAFFNLFNVKGPNTPYSLKTCAGTVMTAGRKVADYQIESIDGQFSQPLPAITECNQIPDNRSEIPTPDVAIHHAHLKHIAHLIPQLDHQAQIVLLLGRDILQVHKVRRHINGPRNTPYAQRLDLGWVIVGDVCLGRMHTPTTATSMLTKMLENGRPSLFQPCNNDFHIKELPYSTQLPNSYEDQLGCAVFQRTKQDNLLAMSIEDKLFLEIMDKGLVKDETNSWVATLPFRTHRPRLPNNRDQVLKRFSFLKHNFQRKPEMKDHFFSFMEKIFENNHAEIAPTLKDSDECWFLPMFGVYHPKKPGQIRVVFDSSAKFGNVSLNDILLTGQDLNNKLLGVLIRFCKDSIAFVADLQKMFHCFLVKEKDRNFLRFLWYRDNNPSNEVTEYRMRVHIFGNSPSPAVAIYGLKRSAQEVEAEYGSDVKQFIDKDFYIDDCLKAMPSNESAISLLRRAQEMLACSNLRLHKIASNSQELMEAFPSQDLCNDLRDLDLGTDPVPMQRSLGLLWNLKSDTFTFQISQEEKPFMRRGVLSTVNSLYDPLGFAATVTIKGKALLRDLTHETSDWDTPLPADKRILWEEWRNSLAALTKLNVLRPYASVPSTEMQSQNLYVFSDASVQAIAAVAYIKTMDSKGQIHIGFVMGKAKLAPLPEHTIPRLELCAAVLAVELAELITYEMDIDLEKTKFYMDSKVVLGYIYNETRQFYIYVNNRVLRIRRSVHPKQWHYIATDHNPADHATRSVDPNWLESTTWLSGPKLLYSKELSSESFELVEEDSDVEIRSQVSTLHTTTSDIQLGSHRFNKFSSWKSLIRAINCLSHIARSFKATRTCDIDRCKGWHLCENTYATPNLDFSRNHIIFTVQREAYPREIQCLMNKTSVPAKSILRKLDPFIDNSGLLRVGGRLKEAKIEFREKFPFIVPGKCHVACLIVQHYHNLVKHQGRLFTEGAIRTAGLWIVGAKKLISSVIFKCITCC
ncbi:uncharacterized protein [Phyllobates terribilis]|uniref:uncharacterized protein n=1 Tax=Phyllobates terribilis TaxID=111132 RepID=UPI003CCAC546